MFILIYNGRRVDFKVAVLFQLLFVNVEDLIVCLSMQTGHTATVIEASIEFAFF